LSRDAARHSVTAWSFGDVRLERYRHAPGPTAAIPRHAHDEYQFGLSLDAAGEYRYRGARHPVPAGALRLIQPGEMHESRDVGADHPLTTHLLYVPAPLLLEIVAQAAGREADAPFFPVPTVVDRDLAARYLDLSSSLTDDAASALERDSRLLATLARFVARHAAVPLVPRPVGTEHRAVGLVKAYLDDHLAENVSLAQLARLADLSPDYLVRAFAREVGLPPHRYQVHARVRRAKTLLAAGTPLAAVARETGFADQSHLGRHFKRLVGVPPGRYHPQPAARGPSVRAGPVGATGPRVRPASGEVRWTKI
jgi:AraC-like DNA-binding protein